MCAFFSYLTHNLLSSNILLYEILQLNYCCSPNRVSNTLSNLIFNDFSFSVYFISTIHMIEIKQLLLLRLLSMFNYIIDLNRVLYILKSNIFLEHFQSILVFEIILWIFLEFNSKICYSFLYIMQFVLNFLFLLSSFNFLLIFFYGVLLYPILHFTYFWSICHKSNSLFWIRTRLRLSRLIIGRLLSAFKLRNFWRVIRWNNLRKVLSSIDHI